MRSPSDSEFTLVVDGTTAIVPCASFTLYLEEPDAHGILDFYQRGRTAHGPALTHYLAESMNRRAKITKRTDTMVPTWMANPREEKDYYIAFMGSESGIPAASLELLVRWWTLSRPGQRERRRANWRVWYKRSGRSPSCPMTKLRVTLPLTHRLSTAPGDFVAWLLDFDLVRRASFVSGSAGYSVVHGEFDGSSEIRVAMQRRLASLCRRYPGLEWPLPGGIAMHLVGWDPVADDIAYYFPRVSWLTVLGKEIVTRLGGLSSLQGAFASTPEIRVHPIGDGRGAIVRAGEAPEVGDLARGELVPLQRRVAEVLRPARLPHVNLDGGSVEDWAQEWLEMFDREHD
jgi:hypothetical protein